MRVAGRTRSTLGRRRNGDNGAHFDGAPTRTRNPFSNPESLVEESHEDGLLEYPSYTKPAEWRGLATPPVLLGGNHAAIAAWRHAQQLERTERVRPELLPPG